MLILVNLLANLVILVGSVWALYTQKVPTRTAGSTILGLIAVSSIVNMDSAHSCHSRPEVMLNVSIAVAVVWLFWRLEIRGVGRLA